MGWEVARELTSRLVVDHQFVMSESFVHQIFFFFWNMVSLCSHIPDESTPLFFNLVREWQTHTVVLRVAVEKVNLKPSIFC